MVGRNLSEYVLFDNLFDNTSTRFSKVGTVRNIVGVKTYKN